MDWIGVNADVEDGVVEVFIVEELIKFAVAATMLEESAYTDDGDEDTITCDVGVGGGAGGADECC